MIINLTGHVEVASMPGGVVGQISFERLIDQLRVAGELMQNETITHIKIDVNRGMIQYRVDNRVP